MKLVSEMTDQELNEWVSKEIMGWGKILEYPAAFHCIEVESYTVFPEPPGGCIIKNKETLIEQYWNPSNNLNHAYLMEERIEDRTAFYYALTLIIFKEKFGNDDLAPSQAFKLINATARQRCEAAYLTFNDPN